MMFKSPAFMMIALLINGCTTLAIGASEMMGFSLLHDRRSIENIARDEKIETEVNIELFSDDEVREQTHFNVTSFNGLVLITGEAPGYQVRNKISAITQSVAGVRVLQNHMTLAYPSSFSNRSKDSLITSKIKLKFVNSPDMPGFDSTRIKVITENAQVFLMGLVYKEEAYIAAENARRVSGVQRVTKVFEYL